MFNLHSCIGPERIRSSEERIITNNNGDVYSHQDTKTLGILMNLFQFRTVKRNDF